MSRIMAAEYNMCDNTIDLPTIASWMIKLGVICKVITTAAICSGIAKAICDGNTNAMVKFGIICKYCGKCATTSICLGTV